MGFEADKDIAALRDLLVTRCRAMRSELGEMDAMDGRRGREERAGDEADLVHQWELHEALRACDAALGRMDLGIYGRCADCREPIALARLMREPQALRCVSCEATHRHGLGVPVY